MSVLQFKQPIISLDGEYSWNQMERAKAGTFNVAPNELCALLITPNKIMADQNEENVFEDATELASANCNSNRAPSFSCERSEFMSRDWLAAQDKARGVGKPLDGRRRGRGNIIPPK